MKQDKRRRNVVNPRDQESRTHHLQFTLTLSSHLKTMQLYLCKGKPSLGGYLPQQRKEKKFQETHEKQNQRILQIKSSQIFFSLQKSNNKKYGAYPCSCIFFQQCNVHGLCQEFEHSQSWNYFRKENLQVLNLLSYLLSTWEFKNTYFKKCRSHLVAPLASL